MKMILMTSLLLVLTMSPAAIGFDFETNRGIGMGRTLLISQPSASSLVRHPGVGLNSGWQIDAGFNRRFELADLDRPYLATAFRWRRISLAVGAAQFGRADLYAEQILRSSFTLHVDSLAFGTSLSLMQVQFGGDYESLSAAAVGGGISYRSSFGSIAATVDRLNRPRLVDSRDRTEPEFTLLTEYSGNKSYAITGRATFENLQKPVFAMGQFIPLSDKSALFWGIATEPLEYGGGIELSFGRGAFAYATAVHPTLGFTHTVSLSFGSFTPRARPDDFK